MNSTKITARRSLSNPFHLRVEQFQIEGHPYETVHLTTETDPSALSEIVQNSQEEDWREIPACMIQRLKAVLSLVDRGMIQSSYDPETKRYQVTGYSISPICDAEFDSLSQECLKSSSLFQTVWEFPN